MSKLIDAPLEETDKQETEEVKEITAPTEPVEKAPVPEKFKDKNIDEVLESYRHIEQELGRSRNEIGELRKFTDTLIQRDLVKNVPEPEEAPDFFDNPTAAVTRAVNEALDKRLKPVEAELASARGTSVRQKLVEQHPDAMQVVATEGFQNWVKESRIRTNLYEQADRQHDLDAATELLGTYKALHPAVSEKSAEPAAAPRTRATVAPPALESSGSTGDSSKKIWRRLDLMRMRTHDLEKYNSMQDEILDAYREGRVR